ncbi:hypothetical protein M4I32_11675 [Microbacterium sp. LRZ72]|uniref:hypothetical protein n=1 Tax=Microbacterium sp. LRZ72 TaxID=2942481 RepID=UPI0029BC5DF5|nr:hypothetical protein [Microbacterium sp. LRZ72]MDX2377459.1 hypothetical protein [Microbacterium sp. LRZ72]
MQTIILLLAIGLCAGVIGFLLFRASPRLTFVVWALVLFFVPVWIGATVGFFWAAATGITLVAVVATARSLRLTSVDALVAGFAVLMLGLFVLRLVSLSDAVIAILEWVLPYAWGRVVLARVPGGFVIRVIAAVATVAAALALMEFATGTNPFVLLPAMGGSYEVWAPLQPRGGFLRVEGAFGHSIALGAALAMSSAFVLAAKWATPLKVIALAVITGAVVATFSRIGLVTLVLTAALSIFTLPEITRRTRIAIGVVGVVAAAIIVPFISDVFLDAGQEAAGSADYRTDLLTLLTQVKLLGAAGDWQDLTVGGTYLGYFANSIDNALIVMALRYGAIPTLLLVATMVVVAVRCLIPGRANPASVAVAAQLPSLLAVALITQYGMYFWFMVGLAVAWDVERVARDQDPTRAHEQTDAVARSSRYASSP